MLTIVLSDCDDMPTVYLVNRMLSYASVPDRENGEIFLNMFKIKISRSAVNRGLKTNLRTIVINRKSVSMNPTGVPNIRWGVVDHGIVPFL